MEKVVGAGEALLGIGACLEAQGKAPDAMTAYKDLIDHRPGDVVLPQAKFALACLYEAQNQPEPARSLFEDVERAESGSIGDEARMRLEDFKTKYPKLMAPATPTPTPMPTATNAAAPKVEKR